jgi:hypothetical protein
MKKEVDAKDINHKSDETLPKHRTFGSKETPGKHCECDNCDDRFQSRKTLEQHQENHQAKQEELNGKVCHKFKKTFDLNVYLEIHMKSHTKAKNVQV